jgi:hypothetical protein
MAPRYSEMSGSMDGAALVIRVVAFEASILFRWVEVDVWIYDLDEARG